MSYIPRVGDILVPASARMKRTMMMAQCYLVNSVDVDGSSTFLETRSSDGETATWFYTSSVFVPFSMDLLGTEVFNEEL